MLRIKVTVAVNLYGQQVRSIVNDIPAGKICNLSVVADITMLTAQVTIFFIPGPIASLCIKITFHIYAHCITIIPDKRNLGKVIIPSHIRISLVIIHTITRNQKSCSSDCRQSDMFHKLLHFLFLCFHRPSPSPHRLNCFQI